MTVQKGPTLCGEYLILDEGTTLAICYMELPCSRADKHATKREIAAWRERVESRIAELEAEYWRLKDSE
jgi:hypothetical protein